MIAPLNNPLVPSGHSVSKSVPIVSAWENCVSCKGSGLQDGLYDTEDCYACKGQGLVRARNPRGQYTVIDLLSYGLDAKKR